MKSLEELAEQINTYAVEQYYEPGDLIQILNMLEVIVAHLQRLEAKQSAVSAALEGKK